MDASSQTMNYTSLTRIKYAQESAPAKTLKTQKESSDLSGCKTILLTNLHTLTKTGDHIHHEIHATPVLKRFY